MSPSHAQSTSSTTISAQSGAAAATSAPDNDEMLAFLELNTTNPKSAILSMIQVNAHTSQKQSQPVKSLPAPLTLLYDPKSKGMKQRSLKTWNVAPGALPGSARLVRVLDRWLNDCR